MFPAIFSINFQGQGQRSRLRLNGVTYNINNYHQDNVFEKYKTSVNTFRQFLMSLSSDLETPILKVKVIYAKFVREITDTRLIYRRITKSAVYRMNL